MKIHNCIIIGSGPSGYTAAIYASRSGLNPILYTGLQIGGQLITTTLVENFPGYENGILGPKMMQELENQAKKFGCKIFYEDIIKVNFSNKIGGIHKVYTNYKKVLSKTVIICTGASPKYLGLPSEKKYLGSGVSTCATCDGFFYKNKSVIVVGGGDSAVEEAIYLSNICAKVIVLVRKGKLQSSNVMKNRIINNKNIKILFHSELKKIEGNNGIVNSVIIINNKTEKEKSLKIDGVFIAIGHTPNSSIFNQIKKDKDNYLITDKISTKTNLPGIFAAGDVQDKIYRQAITASATGCMAALDAERYISSII